MNDRSFACGLSVCRALGQALTARPITAALPDADNTAAFAKTHALTSLLAGILPQDDAYAPLRDAAKAAAFKQIKTDALEAALSRRLSECGIRHIILKGSQLQRFYPANAVRSASDIDIYIDRKVQRDAAHVLQNDGFTVISQTKYDIGFQKPPRYHVELHLTMDGFTKKQQAILGALADNAQPIDGCRYALCDNDCYIYTLFHLYKHFVIAGAGVRMFLDCYMMKQSAQLDSDYINRKLQELGIARFADTVDAVNRVLFEGESPSCEIEKVIAFVFYSRAYGVQSVHLALASLARPITKQSRFSRFITEYCFDIPSMALRYPVLERCVILYPFCCLHRVIHGMIFKKAVLKDAAVRERLAKSRLSTIEQVMTIAGVL